MSTHTAIVVPLEMLPALEEARQLLPPEHPDREILGTAILTASLAHPATAHYLALNAALEAAREALFYLQPDTLTCPPDQIPALRLLLAKAHSPICGPSLVLAYTSSQRQLLLAKARITELEGSSSTPDLKPFLDRLEAELRRAHELLSEANVPYHPSLPDRLRLLLGNP